MAQERPEHLPVGDPCILCKQAAKKHRVDHIYQEYRNRCKKCGLPRECHRMRARIDTRDRSERPRVARRAPERYYLGIDGEGQGREEHKYVLLAANDESGNRAFCVEDPDGLSTNQCLWFFYGLPRRAKLGTYSFGYDLTKILQDCDDQTLYFLFRPELRQRFGKDAIKGPRPVVWNGWELNLQGTKFTLKRKGERGKRTIWDIWKFYQSKFAKALGLWGIGSDDERALISGMKDKRNEFDKESPEKVKEYCFLECRKMAELHRRLVEAHEQAGLDLKSFYGAGSTASVMLDKMGVKAHLAKPPDEMKTAVGQGFFGGRFDNSAIGMILQSVFTFDISSAYPYQCCHLPCLSHGTWELTKDRTRFEKARFALVHYRLYDVIQGRRIETDIPWGPFPFRTKDGSISYPATSGGGWAWQDEYRAAERLFPNVEFIEAWIYHQGCEEMPFQKIPPYYEERCRIGKKGPGIVLKLGCNSCYGKLAQSVGHGRFNSWIWAGMITSGTRAQILEALGLHSRRENMLMVATDGIVSLEDIRLPGPIETGTSHVYECKKHKKTCTECSPEEWTYKPLGGWERDVEDKGMFIARPGVYFPNQPTEKELEDIRGRGVGRNVVLRNHETIVNAWQRWSGFGDFPRLKLENVDRFCGAKTSISRRYDKEEGKWIYKRAAGDHLAKNPEPRYGEWMTRKVEMSFDPWPKRNGIKDDRRSLIIRNVGERTQAGRAELRWDEESAPYKKAVQSEETKQLIGLMQDLIEQPDFDFGEYEVEA